jgi:hypothetical protein
VDLTGSGLSNWTHWRYFFTHAEDTIPPFNNAPIVLSNLGSSARGNGVAIAIAIVVIDYGNRI